MSAVLRDVTNGKWVNADTEVETGCGIVPFTYREKNYVHALQWGIGLELFLLSRDPWQIVLSTFSSPPGFSPKLMSSRTLHAIHRSSVTRATAAKRMPVVRRTMSRIV